MYRDVLHNKCVSRTLQHAGRWMSSRTISDYARRMRTLDHWKSSDNALIDKYVSGQFLLFIDRRPLMQQSFNARQSMSYRPAIFQHDYLRRQLSKYDIELNQNGSVLLDALIDSNNDIYPLFAFATSSTNTPHDELATALDGKLIDLRAAFLNSDQQMQHQLAKAQSLIRWSRIYRNCPRCTQPLHMLVSKSRADCTNCNRQFYPTLSPVAICLIVDNDNEHCLLVRHRRSPIGMYTAVSGFADVGESLENTVRREIVEEVGIDVNSDCISYAGISQPWPFPNTSMMVGFHAIAHRDNLPLNIATDELEHASWFSRAQVETAYHATINDPWLLNIHKHQHQQRQLSYIPPHGAIAHRLIENWIKSK